MPDIRSTALPTVVRDGDDADDSRSSRRYMAALWQVQAAEEDYLRLRGRLLGA